MRDVFICFNGDFDLRLSQAYSAFQEEKKKVQQNKLMKAYLSLSHLVNEVPIFISKSSEKPF